MREFLTLIGQLFIILCIHSVSVMFVTAENKKPIGQLLDTACFVGALFVVVQFVIHVLLQELVAVMQMPF